MKESHVTGVIIVGAGHAGLSASYYLKQYGVEHIVFEKGKVGESWRSQRWDSFKLNTPDKLNTLPGGDYEGKNPEGFCSAKELTLYYEGYASKFQLPVVEKTKVISVEKNNDWFIVSVLQDDAVKQYQSMQVIIASGAANKKVIPSFASDISGDIQQLHTGEYRNASQLPQGAVLVTGGAQSGIQIAEDLADAGRKVYLSTSMVIRVPRNYRGRDIHDWLIDMKFFDVKKEQVPDPAMLAMKPPHLTGVGDKARTISLQSLAKKGVILVGKMESAKDKDLFFQLNAANHIKFADGFSAKVKGMIEEFINKTQLKALAATDDPDDAPDTNAGSASDIASLNCGKHGISSIIWATGFSSNFDYIKLPAIDDNGNAVHNNGIADIEGLYFIGLPWMRHRKSTILFGIKEDAAFISQQAYEYSKRNSPAAVK